MADSISDFFQRLGERGHEPLLGHMRGAVRFDVRGDDSEVDQWVVAVDRGAVTVSHGDADADCVIRADRALFERLIIGEENAIAAVLRGALRVSGDVKMLLTIQRIFPGPPSSQRTTVGQQGGSQ
jgi:putative sterol carrier protein